MPVKLSLGKGVSRKEFTKSSVEEEATGAGGPKGRASAGGRLVGKRCSQDQHPGQLPTGPLERGGSVLPRLRPHPFAEAEGPHLPATPAP